MKAFVVFAVWCVAIATAQDSCYKDVDSACSHGPKSSLTPDVPPCNATYGHINVLINDLIDYANNHIHRSYEYLLMSTHYANYEKNRHGFEKLFRELSDSKWQTAIDIIKHITKRGGTMAFGKPRVMNDNNAIDQNSKSAVYELYELHSLARALDTEKQLALQAFHIHNEASQRKDGKHDTEIAHYIEEEFVEKQADIVRTLAGHIADLNSMLKSPDHSLALYLFDEYLQKA